MLVIDGFFLNSFFRGVGSFMVDAVNTDAVFWQGMDGFLSVIALGFLAVFVASVVQLFRGVDDVWFRHTAVFSFVFFVIAAWLEHLHAPSLAALMCSGVVGVVATVLIIQHLTRTWEKQDWNTVPESRFDAKSAGEPQRKLYLEDLDSDSLTAVVPWAVETRQSNANASKTKNSYQNGYYGSHKSR